VNSIQLNFKSYAGPECFKPEPPSPAENFFVEGMKLEAVDRKNPHFICCASVGEVKGKYSCFYSHCDCKFSIMSF